MTRTRRGAVVLALSMSMIGLVAPTATADWVPTAVPSQTRFVVTGEVADVGTWVPYYRLTLSPVTSWSETAAPYAADGEVTIDDPSGDFSVIDWDGPVEVRAYGFIVADPTLPDGVRLVADRFEETATTPNEAEPLEADLEDVGVDDVVTLADTVAAAHKITLAWTGNPESCAAGFAECSGVVLGPEFLGATFTITMECLPDDDWFNPFPESQVTGRIEIADDNGGELHISLSGTKGYLDPAVVVGAFPTLATGEFADANIGSGSFIIPSPGFCPWPYEYQTTGAAVGELVLWAGPPA